MPVPDLSLAVVGADHLNKRGPTRRFELAMCEVGEEVDLMREPDNPVDSNAVAVFSTRGIQIGYITAERAPWIGRLLESHDVRAVFQHRTGYGAVIRASFDGALPSLVGLPTSDRAARAVAEDPEFWPDPVWDDE